MARCILHVGTHKTGTTTIQTILKHKQNNLSARGFCYPVIGDKRNHNHLAHRLATCSDRELAGIRQLMNDAVIGTPNELEKCLVLSAEEFSTRVCAGQPWQDLDYDYKEKRIRYLARLRNVLSDFDTINTFICFRSHEEYAHALYATKILSGKVDTSFVDFVKDCAPIFDYALQTSLFQSFGPVHVRHYDDMKNDLETSFTSWLGLPVGDVARDRLRRTPPVELIYWLARSVQSGIKKKEREARSEFCRSFPIDAAVMEFKAESLWESAQDRSAFLRSCVSVDGSTPQLKELRIDKEALCAPLERLEELYVSWCRTQRKGIRRFLFWLGK